MGFWGFFNRIVEVITPPITEYDKHMEYHYYSWNFNNKVLGKGDYSINKHGNIIDKKTNLTLTTNGSELIFKPNVLFANNNAILNRLLYPHQSSNQFTNNEIMAILSQTFFIERLSPASPQENKYIIKSALYMKYISIWAKYKIRISKRGHIETPLESSFNGYQLKMSDTKTTMYIGNDFIDISASSVTKMLDKSAFETVNTIYNSQFKNYLDIKNTTTKSSVVAFKDIFINYKINEYGNIIQRDGSLMTLTYTQHGWEFKQNYLMKNNKNLLNKIKDVGIGNKITATEMQQILSQAFTITIKQSQNKMYIFQNILNQKSFLKVNRVLNKVVDAYNKTVKSLYIYQIASENDATLFNIENNDFIIENKGINKNTVKSVLDANIDKSAKYYKQFIDYLTLNNILLGQAHKSHILQSIELSQEIDNIVAIQKHNTKKDVLITDMKKRSTIIEDKKNKNKEIIDNLKNDRQLNVRHALSSMETYNARENIRYYIKLIAIILATVVPIYYAYVSYKYKTFKKISTISMLIFLKLCILFILFI